jgi:hypothetical protein
MSQFQPFIEAALEADASEAAIQARAFDGWTLNGSAPPAIYYETIGQLRNEIFRPHIGGLISPSLFRQAVQPSAILQALSGESSYDWLDGRTADEVTRAAFAAAVKNLNKTSSSPSEWAYKAGSIRYKIQAAVPYIDRGTYIQITELTNPPTAKSVAGPGISESGKHATSQIDLLKNWMYKPMRRW